MANLPDLETTLGTVQLSEMTCPVFYRDVPAFKLEEERQKLLAFLESHKELYEPLKFRFFRDKKQEERLLEEKKNALTSYVVERVKQNDPQQLFDDFTAGVIERRCLGYRDLVGEEAWRIQRSGGESFDEECFKFRAEKNKEAICKVVLKNLEFFTLSDKKLARWISRKAGNYKNELEKKALSEAGEEYKYKKGYGTLKNIIVFGAKPLEYITGPLDLARLKTRGDFREFYEEVKKNRGQEEFFEQMNEITTMLLFGIGIGNKEGYEALRRRYSEPWVIASPSVNEVCLDARGPTYTGFFLIDEKEKIERIADYLAEGVPNVIKVFQQGREVGMDRVGSTAEIGKKGDSYAKTYFCLAKKVMRID